MERSSADFLNGLFGLEGKTAVVIGGTGTLCSVMADGLRQAGCRVVLVGRDRQKAEDHFRRWGSSQEEARFLPADVTNRNEVERIPSTVREWVGRIDIWINGAAVNPPIPYLEISDEEFDRILAIDLKAVHTACQTIGRDWLQRGERGSIINISSMAALRPLSRVFIYSLSKAGILNLTQNLAREWAPNGIRVNALCPGFFPAEQNRRVLDEERIRAIMSHTPMGRFGEPWDLLGATLLLASEQAGGFITGINLVVDGGFSVTTI